MLSPSQINLLNAVKASLFDLEPFDSLDISWDEVVVEAKGQTVMGLISSVIPVHDETTEQCKATYMRIMFEQDRLIRLFDASQIPCVILKGAAAACYYPRPYLRTMGDIDILVPRAWFLESIKLLESNGFIYDHGKKDDELISDDIREIVYIKNGIIVEIHQRFNTPGVNLDDILEPAIERRVFLEINGYRFPALPLLENGLVLLGHINQHLSTNTLGLRQIIDWEMYVHSIADKEFWRTCLLPRLEELGLLTLAAYVSDLCYRYLGLPEEVDFGVDIDDSLTDKLLEVILIDGNFGRRVYADKTEEEKCAISASYGIKRDGFFGYFTRVGFITSSFCKEHPSLSFLAFFYGLFRQIGNGFVALVKNKDVLKKMGEGKELYELRSERNELFEELGVRTGNE